MQFYFKLTLISPTCYYWCCSLLLSATALWNARAPITNRLKATVLGAPNYSVTVWFTRVSRTRGSHNQDGQLRQIVRNSLCQQIKPECQEGFNSLVASVLTFPQVLKLFREVRDCALSCRTWLCPLYASGLSHFLSLFSSRTLVKSRPRRCSRCRWSDL